jgi:hypothetical protein
VPNGDENIQDNQEQNVEEGQVTLREIIPFGDNQDINMLVVPAQEVALIRSDDSIVETVPAALMVDTDQDGLPNGLEERLGTDPEDNDSDDDGYLDQEEVASGYDPLGDGVFEGTLAPIDQAIIDQAVLGQPIVSGEEVTDLEELSITAIEIAGEEVAPQETSPALPAEEAAPSDSEEPTLDTDNTVRDEEVSQNFLRSWLIPEASAQSTEAGIVLKGNAEPHQVVTLYIYSEVPIVATAQADSKGRWEYAIENRLKDGEHQVYVAISDVFGQIVKKSGPFSLFIKQAQAVTVDQFVAETPPAPLFPLSELYWFIAGIVTLLGLGVLLAYLLVFYKKHPFIHAL